MGVKQKITSIADAIRKWGLCENKYYLTDMPAAISTIVKGSIADLSTSSNDFMIQLASNEAIAFCFAGTGFEIDIKAADCKFIGLFIVDLNTSYLHILLVAVRLCYMQKNGQVL